MHMMEPNGELAHRLAMASIQEQRIHPSVSCARSSPGIYLGYTSGDHEEGKPC